MSILIAHRTSSPVRDLVLGVALIVTGLTCLVLLGLSGGQGKLAYLPDGSLFWVPNWFEVAAIVVGGLLIAVPRVPLAAKAAAGGVMLISAGLVFGAAVWAVKYSGPNGNAAALAPSRIETITEVSLMIAVTALAAALLTLLWLARSGALTFTTAPKVHRTSIAAGTILIITAPLMIGIEMIGFSSVDDELIDLTLLGAFALRWSLPWGLAFILAAFLVRSAALGALITAAISTAYIVFAVLTSREFPVLGAACSLVLLTSGWLMTLTWRDAERPWSGRTREAR